MDEQKKSRVVWVDMAKGYGILFVILGHMGLSHLQSWIYTFHMPLFFFLSGYVFSKNNISFKEFTKKKVKTIIIPYICLGIPILVFNILYNNFTHQEALSELLHLLIQRRLYTVWFLACLFCLEMLFWVYLRFVKKKLLGAIIITVIGCLYAKLIAVPLPWNIDVSLMAFPFFGLGYFVKINQHIEVNIEKNKWIILGIGAMLNLIAGFANYKLSLCHVNMYSNKYGNLILFFVSAFAGIICTMVIAKLFKVRIVAYIGCNSLIIFAWHQKLMIFLADYVLNVSNLFGQNNLSLLCNKAVIFILILLILIPITYMVKKSKFKFMIGK